MIHINLFMKLANDLDNAGLYEAANVIDVFLNKDADLQLEMEKEVSTKEEDKEDEDSEDEVETKKKKIVLKFD